MSQAAPWEDAPLLVGGNEAAPWESAPLVKPRAARVKLPRLADGSIDKDSAQYQVAHAAQLADMTKEGGIADPLGDQNWLQKANLNLGAGMQSVIDAAKQRLGTSGAPTSDDVSESRRIDEQLADRTTGGKVLQIAGQAAPLLPLGLIPGMQGVAGGAALGALGGALQTTTDDESAWGNAALGAGFGGAFPVAGKVLKATLGRFGKGAQGAAAGETLARELAPEMGALGLQPMEAVARRSAPGFADAAPTTVAGRVRSGARAVRDWANPVGAGPLRVNTSGAAKPEMQRVAEELADRLRKTEGHVDIDGIRVPVSTAAAIDSPALTTLERGGRNLRDDNWQPFMRSQKEAYSEVLQKATRGADELENLRGARSGAYARDMEEALSHADLEELAAQRPEFREMLEASMASDPEAMRAPVRGLYKDAMAGLDNAGEALTPRHLLSYRTGLNSGYSNAEGRLSSKDAGLTRMKGYYDQFLDELTGGKVTPVTRRFAEASPAVDAAEAASNVRGAFFSPEGRPLTTVSHGNTPTITEARLNRFIEDQARPDRFGGGSHLDVNAKRQLDSLLDVIRRNKNVEQANRFAAPEGSATAVNQFSAKANETAGRALRGALEAKLGPVGKIATAGWDILKNGSEAQRKALMDRAMQDPQVMADLMQEYAKSLGPTRGKDALLTALRTGTTAAGTN